MRRAAILSISLWLAGCASTLQALYLEPKPTPARWTDASACVADTRWTRRACDAVLAKEVFVGMTAEQVRASWGPPSEVHDLTTTATHHEQWVYQRGDIEAQYVYLDNGVVTATQD